MFTTETEIGREDSGGWTEGSRNLQVREEEVAGTREKREERVRKVVSARNGK